MVGVSDGRFFVRLQNEDEGDIKTLNLVRVCTDELTRRLGGTQ